ncbi:MAG: hypothetical protein V7641_1144 [Blastocatellia bacterium]
MKPNTHKNSLIFTAALRRAAARLLAVAMAATLTLGALSPVFGDAKAKATKTAGLTEDQKITHLLNRLGFGARPGDVERVKRIGIDKFIDQQLHPERLDDSAVEARLKNIESIHMGLSELAEKYPEPGIIARELGLKGKAAAPKAVPAEPMNPNGDNAPANQANDAQLDLNKKENRQMVMEYYREHGLKPPQLLLQDLMQQKMIHAVYSERQLQEVLSDFWYNHFNIFWPKGADKVLTTDYEMSAIRPHTLGKFADLLLATAKSPAMMFYLDNFQSSSPDAKLPGRLGMGQQGRLQRRGILGGLGRRNDPTYRDEQTERDQMRNPQMSADQQRAQAIQQFKKRKPGINENYARELMELHTLGVEGGYTQKDVQEVARCFTGWTIVQPRKGGGFIFRPFMHDDGEKTVLGHKIPAGGGMKDGEMVIDILAHHPSTAKFISTKLVRRFVSDNPPPALVDRVAQVYTKSDGDIRDMLRTIFTSPEFYSKEAYRAKIKSPFELAVSAIRAIGGDMSNTLMVTQFISKMGQPLYRCQPPTGYPDKAEQWVNTGALLERLNFGLALSSNKLRGTTVDLKRIAPEVAGKNATQTLDQAIALLLNKDVSPQTRAVLDKQMTEGVPVKGEFEPERKPADAMMADNGESLLADGSTPQRPGKGDKIAKYDFPRGREARFDRRAEQPLMLSPDEQEIAKVFGLVLGSPEFQRR